MSSFGSTLFALIFFVCISSVFSKNLWTLLFYYASNNELEVYTFKDFGKLTSSHSDSTIDAHVLIQTQTQGSYRVHINGDPHDNFNLQRIKDGMNMSDPSVLSSFISSSIMSSPAEHYALIYSGHADSWMMVSEPYSVFPISTLSSLISSINVHFDVIIFDGCLMSMLESLFQLREVTDYVVACETYSPWEGFISTVLLSTFANQILSTEQILSSIADNFILRNSNFSGDVTDVAVTRLDAIQPLADFVMSLSLSQSDFSSNDTVDTMDQTHDLFTTVMSMSEDRVSSSQKIRFESLFNDVVLYYRQNEVNGSDSYNPLHHGISICQSPDLNPDSYWYYTLQLQPVRRT